ncbi:MAG TPA: hypothetical protein VL326_14020 [Kofleriaceae bacterium]|nr:hypothetical protein [Kofleriaceae bacterium]
MIVVVSTVGLGLVVTTPSHADSAAPAAPAAAAPAAAAPTPDAPPPVQGPPSTAPAITVAPPPEAPVAPPPRQRRFSVGLAGHIANSESTWLHLAWMVEVGAEAPRVPRPFFIRGRAFGSLAGDTEQSDWSGDYYLFGAGIEGLVCGGGYIFCGLAGVDLAYEMASLYDVNNDNRPEGRRSGPAFGPRFGIEAGSSRLRVRFIVDRYQWKTHHDPSRWMANGGITVGGAYRF